MLNVTFFLHHISFAMRMRLGKMLKLAIVHAISVVLVIEHFDMAFTLDSMSSNNCNWRNHWNFHSSDRTDALLQPHNVCYRFDFCVVCRRRGDECQQKLEQFSSSQIEWDDSWLSEKDSTVSKSSFLHQTEYNKTIKILLIFQLFLRFWLGFVNPLDDLNDLTNYPLWWLSRSP